jgi:hypothetical protein
MVFAKTPAETWFYHAQEKKLLALRIAHLIELWKRTAFHPKKEQALPAQ